MRQQAQKRQEVYPGSHTQFGSPFPFQVYALINDSNSGLTSSTAVQMVFVCLYSASILLSFMKFSIQRRVSQVFTFKFHRWMNLFGQVSPIGFDQVGYSFLLPVLKFSFFFFFSEVFPCTPGEKKAQKYNNEICLFKCQFKSQATIVKST